MCAHVTRMTCRLLKGLVVGFLLSLCLLNIKTFSVRLLKFSSGKGEQKSIQVVYNTRRNIYVALLTTEKTWENASVINQTWGNGIDQIEFYSKNVFSLSQDDTPQYRLITGKWNYS